VKEQLEMAKKVILKYKDDPTLLMWGIGNEMEGYKEGDDPLMWNNVKTLPSLRMRTIRIILR